MPSKLRIIMAQVNFLLGDIEGNAEKIINFSRQARDEYAANIIVFPELSLTGYPPEDLLLRPGLHLRIAIALNRIERAVNDIYMVIGYPQKIDNDLYNAAAIIYNGKIIANYQKQRLPNYGVFDEKRYFKAGKQACVVNINNINIGLNICEDLWYPQPIAQAKMAGAQLILGLNASPFDQQKFKYREQILQQRVAETGMAILYVHWVGGQDELVFDGGSIAINAQGKICHYADFFNESLITVDINANGDILPATESQTYRDLPLEARIYQALVLGVRDYVTKTGFKGALLGLSGGIDSALSLAIAADALGTDNIEAYMLPSCHTSQLSLDAAAEQAKQLAIHYEIIPIKASYNAFTETLAANFQGLNADATEENIQARCRGVLLMALSNKKGKIVLTTGNKSELAVGYCTLYGDMAGGFCVLKDVYKHMVYRLANYRNSIGKVIPQAVIDRPPSAELAPGQLDQDCLPEYDELDQILELYIEHDQSIHNIVQAGFAADTVRRITKMVDHNEYKRRQAPPGVRITARAFGRDRRYPICSGYGNFYHTHSSESQNSN